MLTMFGNPRLSFLRGVCFLLAWLWPLHALALTSA